MNFIYYFFLFLIYSIAGWGIEVGGCYLKTKKFVNRGFLIGPYCPIYGFGGALITLLLNQYLENPFVLFGMAILICGTLEYLTSYFMEKIFKARWWDYSKRKYNINGRVCLETLIPFGLLGCLIMYVLNPTIVAILNTVPEDILVALFWVCIAIYLTDSIVSLVVISGLRKTVTTVKKNYDSTEEITSQVRAIFTKSGFLGKRLMDAFPKISIKEVKQKIIETTEQVKETVISAKDGASEKIKGTAQKVKEETIKIKEEAIEKFKDNKKDNG